MSGPMKGLEVIKMTGIDPDSLAGQLRVDFGADVIVIDRAQIPADRTNVNLRGKRSVFLDPKSEGELNTVRQLINRTGIFNDGFRWGVTEQLGLGLDGTDEAVIFERTTGWGQA